MLTTFLTVLTEIESCIRAIEENVSLRDETNFDDRADAIDFMEFHILDRMAGLQLIGEEGKEMDLLRRRAERVKKELETVDKELFVRLRGEIGDGLHIREGFREMVGHYLEYGQDRPEIPGYDNLDVFLNGLLSERPIPVAIAGCEPEMVFYQKTPARIVFEMIGRVSMGREEIGIGENDVFFDIGSGLGQVAILVHLISGAVAWGVEREPAYCGYAKAAASRLNLSAIEFLPIDALEADYSRGTIFFLFTPFEGGLLREMLEVLQKEAAKRVIRIFTYGPCSSQVAAASWLTCVSGNGEDNHLLYEFTSRCAEERIRLC